MLKRRTTVPYSNSRGRLEISGDPRLGQLQVSLKASAVTPLRLSAHQECFSLWESHTITKCEFGTTSLHNLELQFRNGLNSFDLRSFLGVSSFVEQMTGSSAHCRGGDWDRCQERRVRLCEKSCYLEDPNKDVQLKLDASGGTLQHTREPNALQQTQETTREPNESKRRKTKPTNQNARHKKIHQRKPKNNAERKHKNRKGKTTNQKNEKTERATSVAQDFLKKLDTRRDICNC